MKIENDILIGLGMGKTGVIKVYLMKTITKYMCKHIHFQKADISSFVIVRPIKMSACLTNMSGKNESYTSSVCIIITLYCLFGTYKEFRVALACFAILERVL